MTIRINNLSLGLDDDINLLKKKASKKLRISADEITNFKIVRESIDARNKDNIKLTYAIELEHKNEEKLVNRVHDNDVRIDNSKYDPDVEPGNEVLNHRPVVVGLGPAGLFSALMLAHQIPGRCAENTRRFIFFQDYFIIIQINFQFVPYGNIQRTPQFDRQNDSSQLIDLTDNSSRFQFQPLLSSLNLSSSIKTIDIKHYTKLLVKMSTGNSSHLQNTAMTFGNTRRGSA